MKNAIPEKLYRYRFYWRRVNTDNVVLRDTIFIKAKTIAAARKKAQELLGNLQLPARAFDPLDVELADRIGISKGFLNYRTWLQAYIGSLEMMIEDFLNRLVETDYETKLASRAYYEDTFRNLIRDLTDSRTELELLDCPVS